MPYNPSGTFNMRNSSRRWDCRALSSGALFAGLTCEGSAYSTLTAWTASAKRCVILPSLDQMREVEVDAVLQRLPVFLQIIARLFNRHGKAKSLAVHLGDFVKLRVVKLALILLQQAVDPLEILAEPDVHRIGEADHIAVARIGGEGGGVGVVERDLLAGILHLRGLHGRRQHLLRLGVSRARHAAGGMAEFLFLRDGRRSARADPVDAGFAREYGRPRCLLQP